jgi:nicotinamide riboside transporter PnuC
MSIASKLRIESKGMLAASIFYGIVGVAFLVLLPTANFPPHLAIIGILSLATAYGVVRKRIWTIWLIVILFFVATTFSAFVIYDVMPEDYVLGTSMIAYLILTWIFTAYAAEKRKALET